MKYYQVNIGYYYLTAFSMNSQIISEENVIVLQHSTKCIYPCKSKKNNLSWNLFWLIFAETCNTISNYYLKKIQTNIYIFFTSKANKCYSKNKLFQGSLQTLADKDSYIHAKNKIWESLLIYMQERMEDK